MRFRSIFLTSLWGLLQSSSAIGAIVLIDNGAFTTVPSLSLDIYDVPSFRNMTFPEVEAAVLTLGSEWRVAKIDDVRPIFTSMTESDYVNSARFLFGFSELNPQGIQLYNTGGRVIDTFPNSSNPDFRYLWGFGNGIQIFNSTTMQTDYIWSSYGIGYDNTNLRLSDQGAWVIRDSIQSIPEPTSLFLLGSMIFLTTGRKRLKTSHG